MFRTPHIFIVSGGYAGSYAAWNLEKYLIVVGFCLWIASHSVRSKKGAKA